MQKKPINALFLFSLKKLTLNFSTQMEIAIVIKRNQKAVKSKIQKFDPSAGILLLNEILQFRTTITQIKNSYESKTVVLQVMARNPFNKEERFDMSTNIQLSQIAVPQFVSKTYRIKNNTDSGTFVIDCRAQLTESDTLRKIQSSTSIQSKQQSPTRQSASPKIKSMQNIPRKKEKNIVISDTPHVKEYDPDDPPSFRPNSKPKKQFISKSSRQLGTVVEEEQGCSMISDKRSMALVSQEMKSVKSKSDIEYLSNITNLNSQINKYKQEIKSLKNELEEQKQKDSKNKRKVKQLEQKIQLLTITEQKGEHGSQQIIKRLHEEIDSKSKQIRFLNEELDKINKIRRKEEDQNTEIRKQLGQIKLEKQKILFQYKYSSKKQKPTRDNSNGRSQDIETIKSHYEEQILQLKQQLKHKTKLFTAIDPQSPAPISNQCFSKQCQQQKKQQQKQIKKLYKRIEEISNKLQTKQKLLHSYQQIQDDRKSQSSKGNLHRQYQKWKAERLMLQEQISQLKSNTSSSLTKNRQLSNIQEELVTYKVQKQNLTKQIEGLRKNLGAMSKDKEKLDDRYQIIERQLIDQKQKLIHLLNAVQELGGMQLYDEISNHLE